MRQCVPVHDLNGIPLLERDEHIRADTTAESLGKLNASFQMIGTQFGLDAMTQTRYPEVEHINHIHTAGNSSGIVDGSAAVLIGNQNAQERLGLKPRARIRALASVGDEPVIMLSGPVPATQRVLRKAGMTIGDIDLFEVNEAFAAVPLYFAQELASIRKKLMSTGVPLPWVILWVRRAQFFLAPYWMRWRREICRPLSLPCASAVVWASQQS